MCVGGFAGAMDGFDGLLPKVPPRPSRRAQTVFIYKVECGVCGYSSDRRGRAKPQPHPEQGRAFGCALRVPGRGAGALARKNHWWTKSTRHTVRSLLAYCYVESAMSGVPSTLGLGEALGGYATNRALRGTGKGPRPLVLRTSQAPWPSGR